MIFLYAKATHKIQANKQQVPGDLLQMVILRILVTNVLSVNHLMFKQRRCSLTKRLPRYQTGNPQVVVADRWNQAVKLKDKASSLSPGTSHDYGHIT